MPPAEGTITTERRGALLLVGINRPAKRNGFTPRMFRELGEAYTLLDDDASLRVGVLFAHGDHFTAGLDLPTIAPAMQRGEKLWPQDAVEPRPGHARLPRRTKPMVVAVQGITHPGIERCWPPTSWAADDCRFSQLESSAGSWPRRRHAAMASAPGSQRHAAPADGRRVRRRRGAAPELVQKIVAGGEHCRRRPHCGTSPHMRRCGGGHAAECAGGRERGPLEARRSSCRCAAAVAHGGAAEGVRSFVGAAARFTGSERMRVAFATRPTAYRRRKPL